jgi:hypothetical protein
MITEQEYLDALGIIAAYREQVNHAVEKARKPICTPLILPKKGDYIELTRLGASAILKTRVPYRVLWAQYRFNDIFYLERHCIRKYGDDYPKTDEFHLKEAESGGFQWYVIIGFKDHLDKRRHISTRSGYEYKIVDNPTHERPR